jgi:hypothetical protein
MDLDYCIFCFEQYNEENNFDGIKIIQKNINAIKYNKNNFDEIKTIKKNINAIKNKKIVIHCNHNYHIGCLVKYHSYKCKDKCIGFCKLKCPLCTIPIKPSDLQKAFSEIYNLDYILHILTSKIFMLYIEIKIKKIILYCKKSFTTLQIKEFYNFNRIDIIYDDLLKIKKRLKIYIRNYIQFF